MEAYGNHAQTHKGKDDGPHDEEERRNDGNYAIKGKDK